MAVATSLLTSHATAGSRESQTAACRINDGQQYGWQMIEWQTVSSKTACGG